MSADYELVPSTDDPNAPRAAQTTKAPKPLRSRKPRLILLALFVVLVLSALYRFWFRDSPADDYLPQEDSKEGVTSTAIAQPTKEPEQGSDKGEDNSDKMPTGKYSVG